MFQGCGRCGLGNACCCGGSLVLIADVEVRYLNVIMTSLWSYRMDVVSRSAPATRLMTLVVGCELRTNTIFASRPDCIIDNCVNCACANDRYLQIYVRTDSCNLSTYSIT